MTISSGCCATVIGGSAVSVATATGVTVPDTQATYNVVPSGVMARVTGAWPTGMRGRAVFVGTEIGVTVRPTPPTSSTYRVLPSGVMAIHEGARRTSIGGPAVPVATEIGVTQPLPRLKLALATYRVLPSGVTAMATGSGMTLIGRPAVPVTVETRRTQSDMSSATYRVRPAGVLMIELDSPTSIGRPTAPVRTEIGVTAPPAGLVSRFAEVTYRVGGI